jgi:hypothetical protein
VATPNPENAVKILLKGSVIFPGMDVELPSVLVFGPVTQGQSLTKEFNIHNHGIGYLTIDSIIVTGTDATEFTVGNFTRGQRVEVDETYVSSATFIAGKIGTKDAKLLVYNTDLFGLNTPDAFEILIMADSRQPGDNTIDVVKLDEIPTNYNLSQNYPNPFNPTTRIEYSLIESAKVRLSVYNSLGQEMMNLVDEHQAAGKYIVDFNATNLPSGIYFYRLQSDKFTAVKKMLLIK